MTRLEPRPTKALPLRILLGSLVPKLMRTPMGLKETTRGWEGDFTPAVQGRLTKILENRDFQTTTTLAIGTKRVGMALLFQNPSGLTSATKSGPKQSEKERSRIWLRLKNTKRRRFFVTPSVVSPFLPKYFSQGIIRLSSQMRIGVPESNRTALRLLSNEKHLFRSGIATRQRWCRSQSLRQV